MRLAIFLLAAAACAAAQAPASGPPRPIAPRLLDMVNPDYSPEARAAGLEGVASVYIEIDPAGTVTKAHLLQGLGMGLDERAIDAVRRWRFEPWQSPDADTLAREAVEVAFRLTSGGQWRIAHATYQFSAEDRRATPQIPALVKPVLRAYTRPDDTACQESGAATVQFDITKDGSPSYVRIGRGEGAMAEAAVRAVGAWRFEPGRRNGKEVATTGEVLFKCGWSASGPAASGSYRVGGGVTAPKLAFKAEPEYSEEARRAKFQGTALLYIEIGPDGYATNLRVARSLGLDLDEKAIEAVRQWRFEPGMKGGQPVTVAATIEVNFRLL